MKFSKVTITFFLIPVFLIAREEPSAFGAGDLSSDDPYGLTHEEKVILETKKTLSKVAMKTSTQESVIDSLKERVDGLQSVVENLNLQSHQNKVNLYKLDKQTSQEFRNSEKYAQALSQKLQDNDARFAQLQTKVVQNAEDIKRIKLAISELSKVLDMINARYVSKDDYNQLANDVNQFKKLVLNEFKKLKLQTVRKNPFQNMSNGKVETRAERYVRKKQYAKAIEAYQYLIKKHYRPAHSHYMLGEIYFKQRDYANAISYFKKSASLYKKAHYSPKLLATLVLHTAIAMEKTHDNKNAQLFFQAVISKYPNSKEAKEAKKHLKK
ncbi:TPR repeat containing exported protein; Putative periplasmic protein contains a protein prenylyltransferase domain [hydrothermal vent metagenome]|uniref:TPR repeat containing exported protein Putative periplasmic protein contains a protein prenylyltransferase domain n=1 Tax=hydrothermal vent metagenome TaxID=652676 RepID=A0A1W1D3B3_9ZZZZ